MKNTKLFLPYAHPVECHAADFIKSPRFNAMNVL